MLTRKTGSFEWCCEGWRTDSPRFHRLVNEGKRLFAETIQTEDELQEFQRQLMTTLCERRDRNLLLHQWLDGLRDALLDDLFPKCRPLRDERETLLTFMERAATGDCQEMTLLQFSGQGEGQDCIKLSTLHSSKGREFSLVIMFAMDEGRIPRPNARERELI